MTSSFFDIYNHFYLENKVTEPYAKIMREKANNLPYVCEISLNFIKKQSHKNLLKKFQNA